MMNSQDPAGPEARKAHRATTLRVVTSEAHLGSVGTSTPSIGGCVVRRAER